MSRVLEMYVEALQWETKETEAASLRGVNDEEKLRLGEPTCSLFVVHRGQDRCAGRAVGMQIVYR